MFDHPYQEFNSLRGLLHHMRVDHDFSTAQLPAYYYVSPEGRGKLSYGVVLSDHEGMHAELAKKRKRDRLYAGRPEDLG